MRSSSVCTTAFVLLDFLSSCNGSIILVNQPYFNHISSLRMQSITFASHRQLVAQHKPLNKYTFLIHYHLSCTSTSIVILVGIVVQTHQLQNYLAIIIIINWYYLTYITEDNLNIKCLFKNKEQ